MFSKIFVSAVFLCDKFENFLISVAFGNHYILQLVAVFKKPNLVGFVGFWVFVGFLFQCAVCKKNNDWKVKLKTEFTEWIT